MSEAELQALVRSINALREDQREMARETDRVFRESKEETDRAIRELSGLFSTQSGKLVEALVEPGCVETIRGSGQDHQ